jgi:hypothetical protein
MALVNVHQTALGCRNEYIFVTNIDVPSVMFQSLNLLQRIHDLVAAEYDDPHAEVFFEASATYTLVHRDSGTLRRWVGSFSPQQNYALTPELSFRHHFFPAIEPLLNLPNLLRQLQALVPDTVWVVDSVDSLIVHVTSLVPPNYHRLIYRGLVSEHGTRSRQKVRHFVLP